MKLNKEVLTRTASMLALKVDKHSPELFLAAGVAGLVVAGVGLCKATLKAKPIIDETKELAEETKKFWEATLEEDDEKAKEEANGSLGKDLFYVYARAGLKLAKVYGPSIALGCLSVAAIVNGHNIQARRLTAVTAAYNGLQEAYKSYQKRVVEEFGEEKEKEIRTGTRMVEVTEEVENENGKPKKVKKKVPAADPTHRSRFARFFDESSKYWQSEAEYNLLFLKAIQNQMNDRLHDRGHLFLSEVYEALGLPLTKESMAVGWVMDRGFDDYVDFGIYDILNSKARDFVNGYERSILLDFNVNGVVYDLA